MCNCIKETEKKMIAFLIKEKGLVNIQDCGFENEVLPLDGSQSKLLQPFVVEHIPLKKDGSLGKEKSFRTSVDMNYCPFCGVKINE